MYSWKYLLVGQDDPKVGISWKTWVATRTLQEHKPRHTSRNRFLVIN